ncbi:dihydrolipoamide acetyltransferase family protein [Goodfellowiella coeruleoviolacea]|uniref:Dihydrolipoamide acetyltransferase component of pyruvate dehydrogenase complex n=1 Tax=Goodfellowiella coeruleoviolacea TaxID=334858 RepID=A0AAE3GG39_9PSEU|nr:dihydrolipoamide acetyltransferase family protein [Goodfellowiella coeruleoviolacea]MCP2166719.1 pyruvate dehydrogenase E2 component (dihydrolipoamide acetyltransferase) [Goodfellowiella coeruleoviolacea]
MTEIAMPRLSDTMEEGVIVAWHKRVGDHVDRGEVLVEIETDKAVMEFESYESGVLRQVLAEEGATVAIGAPIAVLGNGSPDSGSPDPAGGPARPAAATPEAEPVTVDSAQRTATAPAPVPPAQAADRFRASPLARRVARDLGVDLATVPGSGPGGRVTRADVVAAASRATPAAEPTGPAEPTGLAESTGLAEPVAPERTEAPVAPRGERAGVGVPARPGRQWDHRRPAGVPDEPEPPREIPLTRVRRVTARRLTESMREAPHFYVTRTVDVGELLAFRAQLNARTAAAGGTGKVSVNDLVLKACATALRAHPEVNVSFAGDKILAHQRIHLGMAVAAENGLVVAVIRDADRKSITEIAAESRELAGRAREGRLHAAEMSGSTFTVSNLGPFGVDSFTAVINPPEAAILAVGAVREVPVVRDGALVVGQTMTATLSVDHRALDGAVAAAFVRTLAVLLADPLRIVA